ncbi:MAG: ferredoxin:thioredoxin reductase [Candidatus Diapherotrites archaeon]|uniref:ferredoxin:thioredoxin reductase n=1 Tax=Candidatus Iainarchaeum sp. TaxID=3101447 RepID=A0A938YYD1_9ARCH|nr:ferredoxin:thioredoxin reductase [Candidatus Diapherotrites archaeon]
MDELEEQILAESADHAEKEGFALNSDGQIVAVLMKSLARNQREKGKRYCPCRVVTGNKKEDAKIVCPCAFHKDEVEKDGFCRCRLFFRK